jgi:two-component system CheB/CheR fusion protein
LRVRTNGDFATVRLTVQPVETLPGKAALADVFLVILEEMPAVKPSCPVSAAKDEAPKPMDGNVRIAALELELLSKEEYLQATLEEMETANEELKSTNEELQSTNEEMQSTNEELETSKEELQSVNEELATVNAELQTKVTDLSRANNDMNNLLAGTGVGTLFVDHQLRISRFTPSATQVINLIQADIGRPVAHIVSNLVGHYTLVEDVQSVLDSLMPLESEVQTKGGAWYMMRIRPYRTLENSIEGAVITFVDITERKKAEDALRESKGKHSVLFEVMEQGVVYHDRQGYVTDANPSAEKILGLSVAAMRDRAALPPFGRAVRVDETDFPEQAQPGPTALRTGKAVHGVVMGVPVSRGEGRIWIRLNAMPMFLPGESEPYQVCLYFDAITGSVSSGQTGKVAGEPPPHSPRK